MIRPHSIRSFAWVAVPLGALALIVWLNAMRMERVHTLSALGGGRAAGTAFVAKAPPVNGVILPEHHVASYHWILQTQQMFARHEWRVRHIDYENTPNGRAVNSASLYRWWVGGLAWSDHLISGQPQLPSVERAASVADPLLHILLILGTTALVAWRFGALSAALVAVGLVAAFPFGENFLAGAPDDHGLRLAFALWSVLLLVAGFGVGAAPGVVTKGPTRWFIAAGIAGGLGLWANVAAQLPVLAGVFIGGLFAAWCHRRHKQPARLPWRAWALSGSITTLAAYLIEFAPAHLTDSPMTAVHPLYALAWLGCGELLVQLTEWIHRDKSDHPLRRLAIVGLAVSGMLAPLAVVVKLQDPAARIPDFQAYQLSKLTDAATAPLLISAVLPLFLIIPAVWLLLRKTSGAAVGASAAIALGPVLVAVGFACRQLTWWSQVDGFLLIAVAVAAGNWAGVNTAPFRRAGWTILLLVVLLPGGIRAVTRARMSATDKLTRPELNGLIERDLATWLSQHANPANIVALAPPNETTALCYYGGLRGIGSLSWENKEGVAAAVRILSAPSEQEAKALVDQLGVTHIILVSWDTYFDAYARAGTGQIEGTFRDQLKLATLPVWLRPLPYQMPSIEGFDGQSVLVYEVVAPQNEATAISRIATYLVESGELAQAAAVAESLRRFPTNFGAWVARAELEFAQRDEANFEKSLTMLQRWLSARQPPPLLWDQRVRLAILLGKAKQIPLARDQVAICLRTADDEKLRALSAGSLYGLLVLSRAFDLPVDSQLRSTALELLPADLRERLK